MIGFHLPKNKDLRILIKQIVDLDLDAVQIYSKSPRKLAKLINVSEYDGFLQFKRFVSNTGLKVFTHSPYGTNLTIPNSYLTIRSIKDELRFCGRIKALGTVVHPGSTTIESEIEYFRNMIENLKKITNVAKKAQTRVIIENQASAGNKILTKIGEIIRFWQLIKLEAPELMSILSFCIDTCHLFVTNSKLNTGKTLSQDFEILKKERVPVSVVHFNDSASTTADRHENPFEGLIDKTDLLLVLKFCKENQIPMIIERSNVEDKSRVVNIVKNELNEIK